MSMRSRLLTLTLLLTLAACQHLSTASSMARDERPTLPTPPAELAQPERPRPYRPQPSGQLVKVDKAALSQLTDAYAGALGMIEKLNIRIGGWSSWAACQRAILSTGTTPVGC